jgi:hypothetical protein
MMKRYIVGVDIGGTSIKLGIFDREMKLLEKVEIQTPVAKQDIFCPAHTGAVRNAVETTIAVCGYMAVFGACGNVIASFAGKNAGIALMALLDLPSGARKISDILPQCAARTVILAAMTGFGGLCIAVQNLSSAKERGVRTGKVILMTLASTALTAACAALQTGFLPQQTENLHSPYTFSALIAAIFAVPTWISLMNTFFLNKRNSEKHTGKTEKMP